MNISIVGIGYVGLSLSLLISQKHRVICHDISKEKVNSLNRKESPVSDPDIKNYLSKKKLNLSATLDQVKAYKNAEYIIIATPTNYNPEIGNFDTQTVEQVLSDVVKINPQATIIIKSTVPIGFTNMMRKKFSKDNIIFSPEFLRESKALTDNFYPSRIVVGDNSESATKFASILVECSKKNSSEIPLFFMNSEEAEAVKLFANTFLAMRISFFNELDSFSENQKLSTKKIIEGICADPRIGDYYNNPSFGYGGYCLPKDTKQLLKNFDNIPNNIIKATVDSNLTRKHFIVNEIIKKKPKIVGIYRLVMKNGSDNFRESAVLDILKILIDNKMNAILYEPLIKSDYYNGIEVIKRIDDFKIRSEMIIANRISKDLEDVNDKVYSRDIFNLN